MSPLPQKLESKEALVLCLTELKMLRVKGDLLMEVFSTLFDKIGKLKKKHLIHSG